jgi:hypothetical protein
MVIKHLIAQLHGAQVIARLVITNTVPDGAPLFRKMMPPVRIGLGLN